jgi:hypothetical protein
VAGIAAIVLLLMVFLPTIHIHGPSPSLKRAVCSSNVKNIALAFQMYLADNDDRFPLSERWCDTLTEYLRNTDVYRCPSAGEQRCSFAYTAALGGRRVEDVSDGVNTVVVFESDVGWGAAGGPELLPNTPRHLTGDNYGFTDGSARWIARRSRETGGGKAWDRAPEGEVRWEVE